VGLAVRADSRRIGAGAALLHAAEEVARGWGCDRVELTSSRWREEAPRFYEALGYEELSGRQARYRRDL
jgi:GNAT superfamily N-acetyltransferase